MIDLIVNAENCEVRGCEKRTSRNGNEYLLVTIDDIRGRRTELVDKDIENEPAYCRGAIMDFYLRLSVGKFTSVEIERAVKHTEQGK